MYRPFFISTLDKRDQNHHLKVRPDPETRSLPTRNMFVLHHGSLSVSRASAPIWLVFIILVLRATLVGLVAFV